MPINAVSKYRICKTSIYAFGFCPNFPLVLDSFEFPRLCSFLGRKISGEKKEKSQKIIPEIFAGTGVRTQKLKIDRRMKVGCRLKSI